MNEKREVNKLAEVLKEKIVDVETGEIIQEKDTVKTKFLEKEPNFVKIYLKDILYLNELSTSYHNVLYAIIKRMDYDNIIYLMKTNKTKIAEECKLEVNTVAKAIVELTKKEIILRHGKGEYIVNPFLFGKGQWHDIKSLRIKIEYSSYGRTWSTEKTNNIQESIFDGLEAS
jgi:hypothetical protein